MHSQGISLQEALDFEWRGRHANVSKLTFRLSVLPCPLTQFGCRFGREAPESGPRWGFQLLWFGNGKLVQGCVATLLYDEHTCLCLVSGGSLTPKAAREKRAYARTPPRPLSGRLSVRQVPVNGCYAVQRRAYQGHTSTDLLPNSASLRGSGERPP